MSAPTIYIFHGDDTFAIQKQISGMAKRLDAQGMAELNTTRLDGRSVTPAEVRNACAAMPFLAERRLVVLTHPLARIKSAAQRKEFLAALESVPESTALVLSFASPLDDIGLPWKRHGLRKPKKDHWLVAWAKKNPQKVYLKGFLLPGGQEMANWIREYAAASGGEISPQGANLLAHLVGRDTRTAANEVDKLLAYVNYRRAVDEDDVTLVATDNTVASVFDLVDALGQRQGTRALQLLSQLLEEEDALRIFGMVVRQFRLLLLGREALDEGGQVASRLRIHPFVARKITAQARYFDQTTLENIYRRLAEIDEAIKTGEIEAAVALHTLTAALCQ